jgi:exonuclease SbcC
VRSEVQELGQLQKELVLKEQRFETWSRELEELPTGYDQARHEHVKRESERLAPLYERATRLSTQLEREAALLVEMREADGHAARLSTRLTELGAQRAELQFSDEDYASVRAAQELASTGARDAEIAMAAANSELKSATRALEGATQAQSDLLRAQETEHRLQQERRLHEELDRAFTDLRTDLNHALRPDISELASGFLGELTDHRYTELELDDQYNIVVMEDGRSKPVISGGEEDIANLVLRLAISQMIAERAGQSFSLLILDEIFGSLDEVRRHNVVELLRRLHDRFEQVILITHIEAVREGLDRVIAIGLDEETGSSVVRSSVNVLPDPELFDDAGLAGAGVE